MSAKAIDEADGMSLSASSIGSDSIAFDMCWHSHRAEMQSYELYYDEDSDISEQQIQQAEQEIRHDELRADWSQTDCGSHVEFDQTETVPLKEGNFLGRGAMGDVYQTEVMGFELAWKRVPLRRQVTRKDLREIDILRKLSHEHIIRLIGTYTHRQCLGLLLEPVAVCDLHTLFDDIEAHWSSKSSISQKERLVKLFFCGKESVVHKASPIYFQLGCLVSAVAYLHKQKIRHKDLKPSNILLTPESLLLSDFGSATDFSMLSQSKTDNERGTPKYFAPEVAEWEPNGRAADVFSLGCILLEILILNQEGTLERLRATRSTKTPAYHANLDKVNDWIPLRDDARPIDYHLIKEIRAMLSRNPDHRPTAPELLHRLQYIDMIDGGRHGESSIFSECCRLSLVHKSELDEMRAACNDIIGQRDGRIRTLQEEVDRAMNEQRQKIEKLKTGHKESEVKLREKFESHYRQRKDALRKESANLKDEVKKLTAELAESRRLLEQADTAFAKALTQPNNTSTGLSETDSTIAGYLAGDEKAANPRGNVPKGSSKKRTKFKNEQNSKSTDSITAQRDELERLSTANGASKSSADLGAKKHGPMTAVDHYNQSLEEFRLETLERKAAKENKKEFEIITDRGRWPRLARFVGYKKTYINFAPGQA